MTAFLEKLRLMPPFLVWGVMVVIGTLCLTLRSWLGPVESGPVAARFLPVNTLLGAGDLQLPGYSGRYIVAPDGVKQGDAVRPQDVAGQPVMAAAQAAKLLLDLPVPQSAVAGGINAGGTVQLCGKAPQSFGPVTVDLVRCPSAHLATCSAIVEVPAGAAGDLASKGLKDQASTSELHLGASCN